MITKKTDLKLARRNERQTPRERERLEFFTRVRKFANQMLAISENKNQDQANIKEQYLTGRKS